MAGLGSQLRERLRALLVKRFLIRNNVRFAGVPRVVGFWPDVHNEGTISIGTKCSLRSFRIAPHITVRKNAELIIGHTARLNDGVNICATRSIRIGDHAKIGDMTSIYDSDFHEVSPDQPVRVQPVFIGNNVWIGAQSMILPGASIGDHAVIAAGSIVTGEIPARSVAAGSPARVIRTFDVPDGWLRK